MFESISNITIHPGISRGLVDLLISLGLNVKHLSTADLPLFLGPVVRELDPTKSTTHDFLETAWSFIDSEPGYDDNIFYCLPLYLSKIYGSYSVTTPENFDKGPAILAPSEGSPEFALCSKIHGLYMVQPTTFPKSKARTESLGSGDGLMRFTRAISQLAFKSHQSIETYIRAVFNGNDITALRQIYASVLGNLERASVTKYRSVLSLLRQFPLWKNVKGNLVPAANCLLLPHPHLFLPWLDLCDRLIVPEADLSFKNALFCLGAASLGPSAFISQFLLKSIQQHKIIGEEFGQYAKFLVVVYQLLPEIPIEWPLACDGNLRYRKINELYDHRNPFFEASFRGFESEKFLHIRLRKFWDKNSGLISKVVPHDFVAAAKQIQMRGLLDNGWREETNLRLHEDARTVFRALCACWEDLGGGLGLMQKLLRVCFIPTRRGFSSYPRFRKIRMQSLASRRPFNCFQDLVLLEYVDVCWSQVR